MVAKGLALALLAVLAPAAIALGPIEPDRSGEPFLKSLFAPAGQSAHVRTVRYERSDEDPTFTAAHVTELWVDRSGKFRFERSGMWGDGRLIVNDGRRMAIDDLDGSPAGVAAGRKGLGEAKDVEALFGTELSVVHVLLLGVGALESLVEKQSDIVEAEARGVRSVSFASTRFGKVRIEAVRTGGRWAVAAVECELAGSRTRDAVRILPFDGSGRFDTSFAKGEPGS